MVRQRNSLDLFLNLKDEQKCTAALQSGRPACTGEKYYRQANDKEAALLMEFVLHGLSAFSLISGKIVENKIKFKDLMGSMLNLGNTTSYSDEEFDNEDFN